MAAKEFVLIHPIEMRLQDFLNPWVSASVGLSRTSVSPDEKLNETVLEAGSSARSLCTAVEAALRLSQRPQRPSGARADS